MRPQIIFGKRKVLNFLSLFILGMWLLFTVAPLQAQDIPTPEQVLGFRVGEDRKLADYYQIVDYLKTLEAVSPKIQVRELGKTTLGNPFVMAVISSPQNLEQLDRFQEIQALLADPRKISHEQAQELITDGKTVVLINCTIHSTEIGASQMSMELAYKLVTENTPQIKEILDNVIVLLVPVHNPDGQIMVVEWYKKYLGTKYEGCRMPWLYHHYVGHDNNRDWFMFTQAETRITIEKIYHVWRPHVVLDMHQMGSRSARMFVPPYIDPIDPNVDPILQAEMAMLGSTMASELTAQGKAGVVTNAIFDAWTPARAFPNYHGGIRILTEAASCNIASPIEVNFEHRETRPRFDATKASWNHPLPWAGGTWRLRDIVEYDEAAALALLAHTAKYRSQWLRNFYLVGKNAVKPKKNPYAFIIPSKQWDAITAIELLNVLKIGMVEIHRARSAFLADGVEYEKGSYVILLAQPYGAFAKTMLEVQHYPDLRQYPGGPPKRPYDMTGHTLSLLMGVKAIPINLPFKADLELVDNIEMPEGKIIEETADCGYLFTHNTNQSFLLLNRLMQEDCELYWLREPIFKHGLKFPVGTMYVVWRQSNGKLRKLARETSVDLYAVDEYLNGSAYRLTQPRLGLYKSWTASMDEGWTRWVLEQYEFSFQNIFDADIRAGNLNQRFDVIILPDLSAKAIIEGNSVEKMPEEYCGGIGELGVKNLREFVKAGGTLIALDSATELPLKYFNLSVNNVLKKTKSKQFYIPGTILKVNLDTSHPIAYGLEEDIAILFVNSPAFEVADGNSIAWYPDTDPLLSGYILGPEYLHNRSALVEVPVQKGRVILFGFRPQFRAQVRGTYKLLFNSIYYASATLTKFPK